MADQYDGPRAVVSETGDISEASVEETNRIRAQLGLKPLRLGPAEERRTVLDPSLQPAPKPSTAEVRRRIDDSRAKRTRDELVSGPSLGEALLTESSADSAAWVSEMRKSKRQNRSAEKSRNDDKADDDYKDESDLKVVHNASEFNLKVGDELILTLKDRRLIDENGELDDTEDLLENQELVAKSKRTKLRNERNGKSAYNPFDDEDDEIVSSGKKKDVLSHYDEWAIEAKMVKRPKGLDAVGAVRLGELASSTKSELPSSGGISLASTAGVQRDFMTPEEVEAARKKAVGKMKKVKKVKTRRPTSCDDDEEVNVRDLLER